MTGSESADNLWLLIRVSTQTHTAELPSKSCENGMRQKDGEAVSRSSASVYYTERKPKNKKGGGLGTRLH